MTKDSSKSVSELEGVIYTGSLSPDEQGGWYRAVDSDTPPFSGRPSRDIDAAWDYLLERKLLFQLLSRWVVCFSPGSLMLYLCLAAYLDLPESEAGSVRGQTYQWNDTGMYLSG